MVVKRSDQLQTGCVFDHAEIDLLLGAEVLLHQRQVGDVDAHGSAGNLVDEQPLLCAQHFQFLGCEDLIHPQVGEILILLRPDAQNALQI